MDSSDATKYSRETKEYDSLLARIPCAFSKKADFSPWQMKSDFSYFDSESIRRHISVCVASSPSLYIRRTLTDRGGEMSWDILDALAGYPGLKHVGSRPFCVHREWRTAFASCAPRPSHEYLNWILKAQNHRTNEPSTTGSRRASRGRREFRGRVWSIHDVLESRFAVKNSREFQKYERNEKFGRKIPYVLTT